MIFTATDIADVLLVDPERAEDERGFFARTFCAREFGERGLVTAWVQSSVSVNRRRGTLRGLHFQAPPHEEAKLVRCTQGTLLDVVVDVRPASPTFKRHVRYELSAQSRRALYVPAGCAHGFLTLTDDCEVLYDISAFYEPQAARGVRWDDPALAIEWPFPPVVISERDRSYADFRSDREG